MRSFYLIGALLLFPVPHFFAAQALPQQDTSASTSCGGGRSVDDYLAEIAKDQKKKRNRNPLPDTACIAGWCKDTGLGPTSEGSRPTSHPPQEEGPLAQSPTGESSSKPPAAHSTGDLCEPYQAAEDVEVGDFYFKDKNYKAALMRYEEGLRNKPHDAAIHLRLGRTLEKLKESDRALQQYQASLDAAPEGSSAKEARAGLERVRKASK